jgi:hypothetical protein
MVKTRWTGLGGAFVRAGAIGREGRLVADLWARSPVGERAPRAYAAAADATLAVERAAMHAVAWQARATPAAAQKAAAAHAQRQAGLGALWGR